MTPEVISRKLARIQDDVRALREAHDITWAVFQQDIRARAFVERYLHLAIEEVLDVAQHLIAENKWREPVSYRDVFTVLAENNALPQEDFSRFQDMASLRNLLVHAYEKVDLEVVFGIFKGRLDDFDRFDRHVRRRLHQSGSKR